MQKDGYVFVELYVEETAFYVHLFRDALGFAVLRDEGNFVVLRSKQGTILLNTFPEPEPGHPFEHFRSVPRRGFGVEIGIVVERAEEAWAAAKRIEGCVVSEMVAQEWGMTDFRILTPQGFYFRVTTPALD